MNSRMIRLAVLVASLLFSGNLYGYSTPKNRSNQQVKLRPISRVSTSPVLPLRRLNFPRQGSTRPNRPVSSMRFVILSGTLLGDGTYVEHHRFSVRVKGPNPSIKELLAEVKRKDPDRNSVELYGDYYYLEIPGSGTRLVETKTVADYKLKSGASLRIFSDVR